MNNNYSAPMPVGVDSRDVIVASNAALPWVPQGTWIDGTNNLWVGSDVNTLTPAQITTWQAAVAGATNNPNAPWHRFPQLFAGLAGAPTVLRTAATQAQGTTVTPGNVVQVSQQTLNNLIPVFNKLADLLEAFGVPV